MELSLDDVRDLIAEVGRLDISGLDLAVGDVRLSVHKTRPGPAERTGTDPVPAVLDERAAAAPVATVTVEAGRTSDGDDLDEWLARERAGEVLIVRAPMVGVFYRAEKPGATPFVSEGDAVTADTTTGIIEVMKLFHSVRAGVDGVVARIFCEDAEAVGFDQPVLAIELRR